jgi:hypothetical protein
MDSRGGSLNLAAVAGDQALNLTPRRELMRLVKNNDREILMRAKRALTLLAVIGVAVLGLTRPGAAQSAYSYPWCALYGDKSGAQSCYYNSYEQCMATLRGIGGTCIRSPYYNGSSREERRPRRYRDY